MQTNRIIWWFPELLVTTIITVLVVDYKFIHVSLILSFLFFFYDFFNFFLFFSTPEYSSFFPNPSLPNRRRGAAIYHHRWRTSNFKCKSSWTGIKEIL